VPPKQRSSSNVTQARRHAGSARARSKGVKASDDETGHAAGHFLVLPTSKLAPQSDDCARRQSRVLEGSETGLAVTQAESALDILDQIARVLEADRARDQSVISTE